MPHGFRRTKYVVQKQFQFRFVRVILLFVLASSLITGLTIFYTTFLLLGERLAEVYPQGRLMAIFKSVYIALGVNVLLILPVIWWLGIRFSHRIAGPLPKIYSTLQTIGQGNYDVKLVLRKNDELRELADNINQMAQNLREREPKK